MKKIFLVLFVLFCCMCTVHAQDIQYGDFITYKGKVNASKSPEGKGTLVTSNKNKRIYRYYQDKLSGTFSGKVVTKATLSLGDSNGKFEFKGTLECYISENGSSVTYKMTDGKLKDAQGQVYQVIPSLPFIVKRVPDEKHCEMVTEGLRVKDGALPISECDNFLNPLSASTIGEVKYVDKFYVFQMDKEFNIIEYRNSLSRNASIGFVDGTTAVVYNTYVSIIWNNDNTSLYNKTDDIAFQTDNIYIYERGSGKPIYYKDTYHDGYIEYSENGEIMKGYIEYEKDNTFTGNFYPTNFNVISNIELYKIVTQTKNLADLGLKIKSGFGNKGGQIIRYTEGMTHEQYLAEQQRKKEEEERKERERWEKFSPVGTWEFVNDNLNQKLIFDIEHHVFEPDGSMAVYCVENDHWYEDYSKNIPRAEYAISYYTKNATWEKGDHVIIEYYHPKPKTKADVINLKMNGFTAAQKKAFKEVIRKLKEEYSYVGDVHWEDHFTNVANGGTYKMVCEILEYDNDHMTTKHYYQEFGETRYQIMHWKRVK